MQRYKSTLPRMQMLRNNDGMARYEPTEMLSHPENYGPYSSIVDSDLSINVRDITKENWLIHYNSILNIFKDGIETELVHNCFIAVTFTDGVTIDLAITDYFVNLIMWYMLIATDTPIESKHIFFADEIKKDTIKSYIDRFLIDANRKRFSNKELNNIIDDTLYKIHDVDSFAMYLANTVNLEDNIFLMNDCSEFYECMHADLTKTPIEDVKAVGMSYANKAISIMKNASGYLGYDHCLADACRASEGINPKQFKEFTINIGTKPDGHGGIFPIPIYNSFINGGVASPLDYLIESSTGRTAQIIKYENVGTSGAFARLLGLNNMDSVLHPDPNYDCCSPNFVEIVIKDKKTFRMLMNRYYRFSPKGMERQITMSDNPDDLIGKKIYLRSPITCASAARGQGICYKCYGDLAYTVYDAGIHFGVNIGRIASETLSSSLTQKLLSAKHLLETFVEKITWSPKFNEFFAIEGNTIRLTDDTELRDCQLIIDPESIELENEEDDDLEFGDSDDAGFYNEYITEFDVMQNGTVFHISNDKDAKLYISNDLNLAIRKKAEPTDGKVYIDMSELKDIILFIMPIENNELSRTLEHLKNLLNKNKTMEKMNIHQLLQALIDTVIEGGLNITSTHLEVIMSNQVRDTDDILEKAKWYTLNPSYEILSLDKALTCNPSVTISLSYQKVSKSLYNPLTFRKKGSSFMDLFFMEKPQYAINGMEIPNEEEFKPKPGEFYEPMIFTDDPNKVTAAPEETMADDDDM